MGEVRDFYPPEWHDDQTMNVLFSPFRENRDINPQSWDSKLKFWSQMITDCSLWQRTCIINASALAYEFQRKGKMPVCLPVVLQDMKKKGTIQSLEDFYSKLDSNWLSWSYGILVKKPVSWTYGLLVKKPLSWTYSKLFGNGEQQQDTFYVLTDIVKGKAEEILSIHYGSIQHEMTDCIVGYGELRSRCADVCADDQSFHLALSWLCRERKCVITETEKHEKIVRFAKVNKRSITPTSEDDIRLYRLKNAEQMVSRQIDQLTSEMETCRLEAKHHLKNGLKGSAKNCLRRKKKLEKFREEKEAAISNIQHLLTIIRQAETDKTIVDAYASGTAAFKEITRRYGLTPDMIDDVMTGLDETYEMHEEINQSIAQSPVAAGEPSMWELEEELDSILATEDLPQIPTHLPESPHQELVDALCQMKMPRRQSGELDLPSIPSFDPSTPPHSSSISPQAAAQRGSSPRQQRDQQPVALFS